MIRPDGERDATHVIPDVVCSRHNCRELPPCHAVASLTFGEDTSEVSINAVGEARTREPQLCPCIDGILVLIRSCPARSSALSDVLGPHGHTDPGLMHQTTAGLNQHLLVCWRTMLL